MSRLVLHYTDSTLLMLEQTQTTVLGTYFPLEIDKPFARERMSGPIKEALNTNTLSACLWFGSDYTLFPRALFDPAQLSTYYQLNHGHLASQNHLCFQIIEALDLVFIYSIPVWLYDYTKYELQTPTVGHSIAQQLQYLSAQNPTDRVVLLIENAHFVGVSLGSIVIKQIELLEPTLVKSMIFAGAITRLNFKSRLLLKAGRILNRMIPQMGLYQLFARIMMPKKNHASSRELFITEARKIVHKEFNRWFKLTSRLALYLIELEKQLAGKRLSRSEEMLLTTRLDFISTWQ